MQVKTTRFGTIEIDESLTITFPKGILGFPTHKSFALIQPNEDDLFFWLQSIEDPALAFVVTEKPFLVPCKTIERTLREKLFGDPDDDLL